MLSLSSFFAKLLGAQGVKIDPIDYEQLLAATKEFVEQQERYICWQEVQTWKAKYHALYQRVQQARATKNWQFWGEKNEGLERFWTLYEDTEAFRKRQNHLFVEKEMKEQAHLFEKVEGKNSLDKQQILAVVTDEDNNLVVAGAGSGKTTTIVAKVRYLIERMGVRPEEILLISFTQKACAEMKERIARTINAKVDVQTFHALGLRIIVQAEGKKPAVANPIELGNFIEQKFAEMQKNEQIAAKLQDYFAYYFAPYKSQSNFDRKGDYILYFKDACLSVKKAFQHKKSLPKEYLKSIEEVEIANFLFMHNIEYVYEQPYKHDISHTVYKQYKPNYYLPEYDIYIEYFVLDEEENYPAWYRAVYKDKRRYTYREEVEWKRQIHSEHGTALIEIFSYEKKQGFLLKNLAQKLQKNGVDLSRPKSATELWRAMEKAYEFAVLRFGDLLFNFLNLMKGSKLTLQDALIQNAQTTGYEHERNARFLDIFKVVYDACNEMMQGRKEIDFNDMVNHATTHVQNGSFANPYRYIIIDEFQDISVARADLIKALKTSNPACKLFCVGDDWQSIYRFAGSDLSLFTDFEQHFGVTERMFIETTYRFDECIVELSNRFILRNPLQIRKKVRSNKRTTQGTADNIEMSYQIVWGSNAADSFAEALDDMIKRGALAQQSSVLVLGRTRADNYDLREIESDTVRFAKKQGTGEESGKTFLVYKVAPTLSIEFTTAHSAKGLQADYTVILNCSDGKFDFPSRSDDDPVMQLLANRKDDFLHAEERRLFYVAMTRAKKRLYFISKEGSPSAFISEILTYQPEQMQQSSHLTCPECLTGYMVRREWKEKVFYSCTMHPFCEQTMTAAYYEKQMNR